MNVQSPRFNKLLDAYGARFSGECRLFSAPGRVEISGNHTDHNHGKVLAAAVDLDMIAAAGLSGDMVVTVVSDGFAELVVDLRQLAVVDAEAGTTAALIRGIAARFVELGYKIGGFNAVIHSQVLPGSGLSSSAAVEVLIGMIFNVLFNQSKIDAVELAKVGQYAENRYFMKPCGLMDQLACACGGVIAIDFTAPSSPGIRRLDVSLKQYNHVLLVMDTGGSHADLTPEYASVPAEMKAVARFFGKEVLRDVESEDLYANIPALRRQCGDRAVLRAMHFFEENKRVDMQVEALASRDFPRFLQLVNQSGASSMNWLQNCFPVSNVTQQGVMIGLKLTRDYLGNEGACRIHGGGFAGTILVLMPDSRVDAYTRMMEGVFHKGCVMVLDFRGEGVVSPPLPVSS